MRPMPMKPHVVALGLVVLKDLCVVVARTDRTGTVLPSIQSREGEKRTLIVALILVFLGEKLRQTTPTRNVEGKWKQQIETRLEKSGQIEAWIAKRDDTDGAMNWKHRHGVN